LVDGNKLLLTKCRRSDDRHYKNCCDVQNVDVNEYGNKIADFNICYTNNKRIKINKMLMDRAREKNKTLKEVSLELPKYTYSKISQDVYLTLKSPVIAIKNKKEINLINSEMYIIKKIDKANNNIIVKNDNKEIHVPINKFQQWFHVAYCLTAHKAQGQTIYKSYTIHDWHIMDKTCKYVSLSRASSFENVNII
jgi:ATP-dependent exoDNAse (exonuclease V) alpha subunit